MARIDLNHIPIPNDLSAVVDHSIQKAKVKEKATQGISRVASVAALIVVCLAALNFNAVAAFADATKQFFTALYNNAFDNSSRIEAIDNEYFSDDVLVGVSESHNLKIELVNYYIDSNEAGFEYVVTGQNLDEYSDRVLPLNRRIAITDKTSGEAQIWEETFNPETGVSTRTFPGGRFFDDPQNGQHEYVKGIDISSGDTRLTKIGADTYSLVDYVKFSKPIIVGDEISLQYSSLTFIKESHNPMEDTTREYIEGEWNFKIVVDDKFKNTDVFTFEIVNGDIAAQKGIRLENVSLTPLATKLTFAVDYTKNEIVNPDNINLVSEPQYVYKLNLMDLCGATVIQAGDNIYENKAGSFVAQENETDYCILEFDTLYFKSIESFSVNITERNGEITSLEVESVKP